MSQASGTSEVPTFLPFSEDNASLSFSLSMSSCPHHEVLTSIKQLCSHGHTWAGGSQHRQGLSGVGLLSEALHKLFLAFQKAEVPCEGSIEDKVDPWKVMEGVLAPKAAETS